MIYRKKILIALVELFGGELSATYFQKLLFILSVKQAKSKFDFVPYKYGCFSFQAMADKNNLIKVRIFRKLEKLENKFKECEFYECSKYGG